MLIQQCQPINACISGIDIGVIEGNADISRVTNTCTLNSTTTTTTGANTGTGSGTGTGTGAGASPSDDEDGEDTIAGLPKNLFIILVAVGLLPLMMMLFALSR